MKKSAPFNRAHRKSDPRRSAPMKFAQLRLALRKSTPRSLAPSKFALGRYAFRRFSPDASSRSPSDSQLVTHSVCSCNLFVNCVSTVPPDLSVVLFLGCICDSYLQGHNSQLSCRLRVIRIAIHGRESCHRTFDSLRSSWRSRRVPSGVNLFTCHDPPIDDAVAVYGTLSLLSLHSLTRGIG
jgi:hypothetical protein